MTEAQRLEMLDGLVWMSTYDGLTAAAAKSFLGWIFYGQKNYKDAFNENPVNTFAYRVLNAAIVQSAISTYDVIKQEKEMGALEFSIDGYKELRLHRLRGAHPWTHRWTDKQMQEFVDADLHHKDNPARRLWQVRGSILKRLIELGSIYRRPLAVTLQIGVAEMIKGSITQQLKPGVILPPNIDAMIFEFYREYESRLQLDPPKPKLARSRHA